MKLLIATLSMTLALAVVPATETFALSSSASATRATGGGVHGKIISVTTTNFALASTTHGRHRRTKSTLVHYNPRTVSMTMDGVPVQTIDVAATGKYVSVVGVMKNNILEATRITVTSTPSAHGKKSKSAST